MSLLRCVNVAAPKDRREMVDLLRAAVERGVTFFDTAEVYGDGESERIIGGLLAGDPQRAATVQLATKFMPVPWKLNVRSALLASLRASLERLGRERVDLYQIHRWDPKTPIEETLEALHDVVKKDHMTWSEVLINSSNIGMTQGVARLTE